MQASEYGPGLQGSPTILLPSDCRWYRAVIKHFRKVYWRSVDWGDRLITFLASGAFVSLSGYKLSLGRTAKQADIFDRFTKEIAVSNSLLKLKLSASEPNSPQQSAVKNLTYKDAEALEEQLKRELAKLTPPTPRDGLWWRPSSLREKFLPERYEGNRLLSRPEKRKWLRRIVAFYALLFIYALFMWELCRVLNNREHVPKIDIQPYVLVPIALVALGFVHCGSASKKGSPSNWLLGRNQVPWEAGLFSKEATNGNS